VHGAGDYLVSKRDGWLVAVIWGASARLRSYPRSLARGPACSLDRLLLKYGNRRIMVSPADRAGFLSRLAALGPQLRLAGERLIAARLRKQDQPSASSRGALRKRGRNVDALNRLGQPLRPKVHKEVA
jgi:hypothetical protein